MCRRSKLRGMVLLSLVTQVSKEALYCIESFIVATANVRYHTSSESVSSLKLQFSSKNTDPTLTRLVFH